MTATELILTGPDGANPLGYLCALGTLRTLSNAWPEAKVKMAWKQDGATWRPVLRANADLNDHDALVNTVYDELKKMEGHPAFNFRFQFDEKLRGTLWETTSVEINEYREYSLRAAESTDLQDRRWGDFVVAFGCDAAFNSKGKIYDTPFRFVSGQQSFLETIRTLIMNTDKSHLSEALFGPWMYQDNGRKQQLRWDPAEYRKHALRWQDPNSDKIIPTVRGANRLAIEALPLFPSVPSRARSQTAGFSLRNQRFTWPLWKFFASLETVRSLVCLSELSEDKPARDTLSAMGVVEVYRSTRVSLDPNREESYRNFAAAQPV